MSIRLYIDVDFQVGQRIRIPKEELHYLKSVRRGSEYVEVFNRIGQWATAKVDGSDLEIESFQNRPEPEFKIRLAVGLPEMSTLKQIIRQASELGVEDLILFPADRSQNAKKRISEIRKFEKYAIESARQCERSRPLGLVSQELKELLDSAEPSSVFVLDELTDESIPTKNESVDLDSFRSQFRKLKNVLFLIGPEGGWSSAERQFFIERSVSRLHLPTPILRVDTACISAVLFFLMSR